MHTLTVGLIGAGGISHVHAPSWQSLGLEVLVFSEHGGEALDKAYGVRRVETLADLLAQCDVVDICTPTPTHPALVRASMDAGRPVFCEKPLARTAADAAELVRMARDRALMLFPGHVVRYFPEYRALHDAVASGRLGEPAVLRFSRISPAPASAWFFDEDLSGGIVLDFMLHDIDQARLIGGEVVAVSAAQNPPTVAGAVPRNVVAHVTLTHRAGAISHIQAVWGPAGVTFATSFDVAGSRGRLHYDSRSRSEVLADVGEVPAGGGYLPPLGKENPYAAEMSEFIDAVRGGATPRVTAADAVISVALAEAAIDALRSCDSVPFDEALVLDQIGVSR